MPIEASSNPFDRPPSEKGIDLEDLANAGKGAGAGDATKGAGADDDLDDIGKGAKGTFPGDDALDEPPTKGATEFGFGGDDDDFDDDDVAIGTTIGDIGDIEEQLGSKFASNKAIIEDDDDDFDDDDDGKFDLDDDDDFDL